MPNAQQQAARHPPMAPPPPGTSAAPAKVANTMADLQKRDFWAVVIGGTLLSAVAGYINAATMIGLFTTTVSHLTGTTTRLAVTMVQNKWDNVLRETTILFGFLFGSFVCGIIVRSSKFRLTRRYGAALLLESLALAATTLCLYAENYIAPVVAAFACGLQNGLTSGYSGAIVRTTHVTGTVTDIGLIIGQNLLTETRSDLWKLKVLVPLLVGYWAGGLVGTVAYVELDYLCFVIPAVFVGVLGLVQIFIQSFMIHKTEVHDLELRKARARARRAAKKRGRPLLDSHDGDAVSTSSNAPLVGNGAGTEVIEMPVLGAAAAASTNGVHEHDAHAMDDDHGVVPLVLNDIRQRKTEARQYDEDDEMHGHYDTEDDDH